MQSAAEKIKTTTEYLKPYLTGIALVLGFLILSLVIGTILVPAGWLVLLITFLVGALGLGLVTLSLFRLSKQMTQEVEHYKREADNKATEMEVAHEIQTSLMPPREMTSGGWTLSARSLPARDVGGDFYEYVAHPHLERTISGVAIGDVAGKGIPAALQMAVVRTLFRVEARRRIFPGETLSSVNMALQAERSFGMVTMLYAFLDTVSNTLHIANAGHNYPLILTDTLTEVEMPGLPLGIDDDAEYNEAVIKIEPGTSVILYTDGVVEAMDEQNEIYTYERFKESLWNYRHLEPTAMVDQIIKDIAVFTKSAPQSDDITVIVLQYLPVQAEGVTVNTSPNAEIVQNSSQEAGLNWI